MKSFCVLIVALVAGVSVAGGSRGPTPQAPAAAAARTPVPARPLGWPVAVETAFKQRYPKATVKAVIRELSAGKTIYEVESVDGGRRRNIDYNADGTILTYEEELTEGEVPAAVRAAIKTRYPAAVVTLWERLYTAADKNANYECQLSGAAVREVILTPDGKWISPKGGL